MKYNQLRNTEVFISALGLGGHEFLPDGKSRGFNEDFARAVKPGEFFEGFGEQKRQSVLRAAYDAGINFFDATIDSEKAALGRNVKALPSQKFYVQTRPEGMGYNYDLHNRKMADFALLRAEVQRILELLNRERLDFLNFPFMASALENDEKYLDKIAANIAALKDEGLIRFAVADTFSGEATYLRQIETGCFDALFINFNFVDNGAEHRVLQAAAAQNMGVLAREAFNKGALFQIGAEAGETNRDLLAQVAVKWILSHPQITCVMIGLDSPDQLECQLNALEKPQLSEADNELLQRLRATEIFQKLHAARQSFLG